MQFQGHASVVEADGALAIVVEETGSVLYRVPDGLSVSRSDLKGLADHFTARQNRDGIALQWFERARRHLL